MNWDDESSLLVQMHVVFTLQEESFGIVTDAVVR